MESGLRRRRAVARDSEGELAPTHADSGVSGDEQRRSDADSVECAATGVAARVSTGDAGSLSGAGGSPRGGAQQADDERPCPLCQVDDCIDPVESQCGHAFCVSCAIEFLYAERGAVHEQRARGACPVCRARLKALRPVGARATGGVVRVKLGAVEVGLAVPGAADDGAAAARAVSTAFRVPQHRMRLVANGRRLDPDGVALAVRQRKLITLVGSRAASDSYWEMGTAPARARWVGNRAKQCCRRAYDVGAAVATAVTGCLRVFFVSLVKPRSVRLAEAAAARAEEQQLLQREGGG